MGKAKSSGRRAVRTYAVGCLCRIADRALALVAVLFGIEDG